MTASNVCPKCAASLLRVLDKVAEMPDLSGAQWAKVSNFIHAELQGRGTGQQPAQPDQQMCFCDSRGIGEPGVTCGDCPRDYKRQPAQPESGEASIQQCCDDLFEAGRTVAHYEDPRLRPLSKEDFILYDAARKRAAAARDRLQSALTAITTERDALRRAIAEPAPDIQESVLRKLGVQEQLTAAHQRLSEQETLLAERNRQNAAAFADRDALLADQRRLLYLASTASMNWGHRDRAGYTLDPLQFESARDVIHPDDFRRAIDAAMAGPCPTCHGSGLVTIRGMCGGVEMDCDDQPCPDCADIREAAR